MSSRRRTLVGYKACKRCKLVVREDATQCPNCGSEDFTLKWRGMIVVIDPNKSCIAKRMNISKPGIYAVELEREE